MQNTRTREHKVPMNTSQSRTDLLKTAVEHANYNRDGERDFSEKSPIQIPSMYAGIHYTYSYDHYKHDNNSALHHHPQMPPQQEKMDLNSLPSSLSSTISLSGSNGTLCGSKKAQLAHKVASFTAHVDLPQPPPSTSRQTSIRGEIHLPSTSCHHLYDGYTRDDGLYDQHCSEHPTYHTFSHQNPIISTHQHFSTVAHSMYQNGTCLPPGVGPSPPVFYSDSSRFHTTFPNPDHSIPQYDTRVFSNAPAPNTTSISEVTHSQPFIVNNPPLSVYVDQNPMFSARISPTAALSGSHHHSVPSSSASLRKIPLSHADHYSPGHPFTTPSPAAQGKPNTKPQAPKKTVNNLTRIHQRSVERKERMRHLSLRRRILQTQDAEFTVANWVLVFYFTILRSSGQLLGPSAPHSTATLRALAKITSPNHTQLSFQQIDDIVALDPIQKLALLEEMETQMVCNPLFAPYCPGPQQGQENLYQSDFLYKIHLMYALRSMQLDFVRQSDALREGSDYDSITALTIVEPLSAKFFGVDTLSTQIHAHFPVQKLHHPTAIATSVVEAAVNTIREIAFDFNHNMVLPGRVNVAQFPTFEKSLASFPTLQQQLSASSPPIHTSEKIVDIKPEPLANVFSPSNESSSTSPSRSHSTILAPALPDANNTMVTLFMNGVTQQ